MAKQPLLFNGCLLTGYLLGTENCVNMNNALEGCEQSKESNGSQSSFYLPVILDGFPER